MSRSRSQALARRPHTAPPALVTESLAQLEQALGGRTALVAALMYAPKSRDLAYVLGLVGDPQHARLALADICAMGGITAGELVEAYKAGVIAGAQALASQRIGAGLPGVVDDTLRLAVPHEATCPDCRGTGAVTPEPTKAEPNPGPEPCEACDATGQRTYPGDLDHKKLSLEMGKLLVKGPGLTVAVTQNTGLFLGAGGALEKLQEATDRVLYGEGPNGPPLAVEVLDGSVMEATAEGAASGLDPDAPHVEGDWREDLPA